MDRAKVKQSIDRASSAGGDDSGSWRDEIWATLSLAIPLALAQLAHIGIQTTDVVMMGWLGPEALAAGTLGANIYTPLWLFGLGIGMAVAPMAAQALGAGEFGSVRRIVRQGFWVATAVSLPSALVIWQGEAILLAFGQTEVNAGQAGDYLRVMVWGFAPSLWLIVLRCFVAAHGRAGSVLVVMILGVLVNFFGNYTLMFGHFGFPALGLIGAGISTSIVNMVMCLALLAYVLWDRKFRHYAILIRLFRADWPRFREILHLGLPIGVTILAESGLFAAAGLLMGLIGTEQLAAHAIALQCAVVAFMIPLGISQATTIRVGLAAGMGSRNGVGQAGWCAMALGLVFMLAAALCFLLLPEQLVDLFLDLDRPDNLEVLRYAVVFLSIAALFQVFDGAQVVSMGGLRGLKDTRVPMYLAILCAWGIGFAACAVLAFPLGLGGVGIWLGLALGLAALAGVMTWRFHRQAQHAALGAATAT